MEPVTFNFTHAGKFISRGKGRHITRKIQSFELIYVIKGTLKMFEGQKIFELAPGDFLLLYPGVKHGGLNDYPADLSFFWGHFHAGFEAVKELPKNGHCTDTARMAEYFSMLLAVQASDRDAKAENLLLELLLNEITKAPSPADEPPLPGLVTEAVKLIKLHCTEGLSTSKLAEKLQCNPDYLGRIFRKYTGSTLTASIINAKLDYAAMLMQKEYMPVKTAAYSSGFGNLAYFRKCFLQRFSMRPAEFRELYHRQYINTL